MSAFMSVQDVLEACLSGELRTERLAGALAEVLRTRPQEVSATLETVQQLEQVGRLPSGIVTDLKGRLELYDPDEESLLLEPAKPVTETVIRKTIVRPRREPGGDSGDGDRPGEESDAGPPDHKHDDPHTWTDVFDRALRPGMKISHQYVLEEEIGRGGMGIVFKAKDLLKVEARDRNPYVAIKFLSEDFRRHESAFFALQRETAKAQELTHPNIVNVHGFHRHGTLVYMTMEYLEGRPLDEVIASNGSAGMDFAKAWPIIKGIGDALSYAHTHPEGVVHSDLKPPNVFLLPDGRVKVLDFGIARALSVGEDSAGGGTVFDASSLGALTPAYASPEMFLGLEPDARDDVFALACISYELLTGSHPFRRAPSARAQHLKMTPDAVPGLGRRRKRALLDGLAFVREDRTSSVEEFLRDLEADSSSRIQRMIMVVLASVAVMAGGSAAWFMWQTERASTTDAAIRSYFRDAAVEAGPSDLSPQAVAATIAHGRNLLSEFEKAGWRDGRISVFNTNKSGYSAYYQFLTALRADPANEDAAEGLLAIVRALERVASEAVDAGDLDRARALANAGLAIYPGHRGFQRLQTNLGESDPAESASK